MRKILLGLFLICSISNAQTLSADDLLDKIKSKLGKVEDYQVNIEISVDMDFLKMPKSKAKLYFKKPDKVKFHSEGFAVLPKAGVNFNPQNILEGDFTAIINQDTVLENSDLLLINITSNNDSAKFESANLIVDQANLLIKEINLSPGSGASIVTKLDYDDLSEYALPSNITVNLDISDIEKKEKSKRRRKVPQNFKGIIIIKYLDYQINQGIDDSIFDEEEKDESDQ